MKIVDDSNLSRSERKSLEHEFKLEYFRLLSYIEKGNQKQQKFHEANVYEIGEILLIGSNEPEGVERLLQEAS